MPVWVKSDKTLKKSLHGLFQIASARRRSAPRSVSQTRTCLRNDAACPCGAPRAIKKWPAGLAIATALLLLALPAGADFKVVEVQPRLEGRTLVLNGGLDLTLTSKVEEALSKGIPLEVMIDVRLYRKRWVVWHQGLGRWTLRRRIAYHALSGQYLVGNVEPGPDARESHGSLLEALRALGALNGVRLPLAADVPPEGEYGVELRAVLDIEALPAPLRPLAYTSLDWRLNSGWSTWKLAP